jgi:hypothetical protein
MTSSARLLLLIALLAAASCDPGWWYEVPDARYRNDGTHGAEYQVKSSMNGVSVWAGAGVFTSSLSMYWDVENATSNPLPIAARAIVKNAAAANLHATLPPRVTDCEVQPGDGVLIVPAGGHCRGAQEFEVVPLVRGGCGSRTNPDLATLYLSILHPDGTDLARVTFVRK